MSLALYRKFINKENKQYLSIDIGHFEYLVDFSGDADLFHLKKEELLKKGIINKSVLEFHEKALDICSEDSSGNPEYSAEEIKEMFDDVLKVLNSDKRLFSYTVINKKTFMPLSMETEKYKKENKYFRYFLKEEELGRFVEMTNSDRLSIAESIRKLGWYNVTRFTFNDYSTYSLVENKFDKALKVSSDKENIVIETICEEWTRGMLLKEIYSFCEVPNKEEYVFYTVAGW